MQDKEIVNETNSTELLDRSSLPHPSRSGSHAVLATIENLVHVLTHHRLRAQFNVIKKRVELRYEDGRPASMSEVVNIAIQNQMATGHIFQFVDEIAHRHPYNPVKAWILSRPWDGTDRLPAFMETVRVAEGYPPELKRTLLHRWLLSAVAAALSEGRFRARGVLTLQGPQGIGKTSWVASLMPDGELRDECILLDHHLDGGNKDSVLKCIAHWITEIGELDSSFKRDIARLKGFLTNDCDKIRRPYARQESEYSRRTVFAATVNEEAFLIDATGNSRWWTIAVEGLEFKHGIDMQQLYAQLAVQFSEGVQWWLTPDEERQLALYNLRHRSSSAIAERVQDFLDLDRLGHPGGRRMTAIELLAEMGIQNPTNAQCKECGSALRELLGPPKRIQGRYKWSIHVRAMSSFSRDPIGHREEVY